MNLNLFSIFSYEAALFFSCVSIALALRVSL